MSLRDDLLARGSELVDDKSAEWLEKAEAAARAELGDVTAKANELLAPTGATVTEADTTKVLDTLAKGKEPLARLTSVSFAWIVANLESGDEAEARRLYLEHEATFDERNAAMDAAGDRAFDEAKERNDAWEALKAIIEEVGEVGLTIVVAVARKAVGL